MEVGAPSLKAGRPNFPQTSWARALFIGLSLELLRRTVTASGGKTVYDKADSQRDAVADYLPEDLPPRVVPNPFRELL